MAFRPNASVMNDEAEKADQREARREGGDLRWYNFKHGRDANILRFLPPGPDEHKPPYIPEGKLSFPVYKHKNIPGVTDLKEASCVDVARTFPTKGIECPVKNVLAEIYSYCTEHKIERGDPRRDRFFGPEGGRNTYYLFKRAYTNCIDRQSTYYLDTQTKQLVPVQMGVELPAHLIPAPLIIGLPLTLNDWLYQQWRSKMVGDFTDEEKGYDVIIDVTGQGTKTKYAPNMVPNSKPLHPNPVVRQMILDHMYNIAEIFRVPPSSELDKTKGKAALCRKFAIECGLLPVQVQVPAQPTESAPAATAPAPAAAPAAAVAVEEEPPATVHPQADGVPAGAPACFLNHIVGLRDCVVCPWEASCMEASDRAKTPLDQRQLRHEAVAQQREASRAA